MQREQCNDAEVATNSVSKTCSQLSRNNLLIVQLGCCGITFLISSKVERGVSFEFQFRVSRKRSSQKQLLHAQSWIITKISQLLFAFTLEKVWNMFKYINKDTRKRQWRVSIVHFELVNFSWAVIVTISNLELFVMAQLNVFVPISDEEKKLT